MRSECRWRSDENDVDARCGSPKLIVVRGRVPLSLCEVCYCRDHEPIGDHVAMPLSLPMVRDDCVHLGGEVRVGACPSCRGTVRIKVFACSEFGECSLHKSLPGLACCQGCPKYQKKESG